MPIKILAVGDVCGQNGLDFLGKKLPRLKQYYDIDFTVVNGENSAVLGLYPRQAEEIFAAGADVITLGNHTWSKQEIKPYLDSRENIIRPANLSAKCPGAGYADTRTDFGIIRVICLIGRYGMDANAENPFTTADGLIRNFAGETPDETDGKIILVEFHAEGTSEKGALGYYLDGRVSAVWGTHTHVQTSDAGVLPLGTGFITDLGMTGPSRSVLGIKPEQSISKFMGEPPTRYESAEGGCKLEACVFEIDDVTKKCLSAEAVRII